MVVGRFPRRFNVLAKPVVIKASSALNRRPKYVGFRQDPVSSVKEASPFEVVAHSSSSHQEKLSCHQTSHEQEQQNTSHPQEIRLKTSTKDTSLTDNEDNISRRPSPKCEVHQSDLPSCASNVVARCSVPPTKAKATSCKTSTIRQEHYMQIALGHS